MKVFRDESTGYLIIDGIEEGVQILPVALYQGYLKQIEDLKKDNKDLRSKLDYMSLKLADALSAQAEAENKRAETDKNRIELIRATAESEFNKGLAVGFTYGRLRKINDNGEGEDIPYELARQYWYHFDKWYASAMDTGKIDMLDAEYERRITEKERRCLQDHSDSQ